MEITILQVGLAPEPIREDFSSYPEMFMALFAAVDAAFTYRVVPLIEGADLPALETCEAILITGSAAGVYDDLPWIAPLRDFVREAYAKRIKMVGICFGHQIMAEALGADVAKSDKGWGLGRHTYQVLGEGGFLETPQRTLSITCSHQDQVLTLPQGAEVIMASDFAPHAGLSYDTGAAISFQPHPEFADDFTAALARSRRGRIPEEIVDEALASLETIPSDRLALARAIVKFLKA